MTKSDYACFYRLDRDQSLAGMDCHPGTLKILENIVKVEFDPAITDEKKLIECVHGIADGKYHVSKVEVLHYHGLQNKGAANGAAV